MGQDETLDLGAWFIVRCGGQDTLTLFEKLTEDGFFVWTPTDRKTGRKPRTRKQYDKLFALMPSYLFVDVEHLDDMISLAMFPNGKLPRFHIMQYRGGIPLIADRELRELKMEETRRDTIYTRLKNRGRKVPDIPIGQKIAMQDGGFAGMSGTVVGKEGRYTLVDFDAFPGAIKISSLLLHENMPAIRADRMDVVESASEGQANRSGT